MTRRWVVQSGGPETLAGVLQELGAGTAELQAGRVFVGGRRARSAAERVRPGDRVEVARPPAKASVEHIRVLGERDGLLAVLKPAGVPTEPDRAGCECLLHGVARCTGAAVESLHALSRLDTPVSGVVLIGRSAAARARVEAARARGALRRRYVALAARGPHPTEGVWERPIASVRRGQRASGKLALTRYASVAALSGDGPALLVVEPVTGRTHQIRVHASEAGSPLLGDRRYGGPRRLADRRGGVLRFHRIALHAWSVAAPVAGAGTWEVQAPLPEDLRGWWARLGGGVEDWERARRLPPLWTADGSRGRSSGDAP